MILDDARNFLLTTREKYDLIVSEPSNPWIAGVATLFTEEYYRAARARLTPGGIFVQWVQAYSLYPEDLRMVLATFVPQFPQVTLWHGDDPDLLLLARTESAPLRFDRFRALWANAALRADFESLGLRRPEGLAAFYLLDDAELRLLAANASRNTDDHTHLEYRAPRALLAKHREEKNREMILEYQQSKLPPGWPTSQRAAALAAAAEAMLNLDEKEEADRFLELLADDPPTAERELLRGRLELAHDRLPEAKAAFALALRLDRNSLDAAQGLAEVARRRGDAATAELLLRQILARNPNFVPALHDMVLIERDRKAWQQAADWQARRIATDSAAGPDEYCRLGELLVRMGELQRGERAFLTALHREPFSYTAHRNLGEIYRQRKLWPQARAHLEFVARYFPDTDADTYVSLAEVYRAIGETTAAVETLRKGLRIFPGDADLRRLAPPG